MMFVQPGSKSNERMMGYIPNLYNNSRIMNELMNVRGYELETAIKIHDDILNQFFIATATWMLPEYEKEYGLPVLDNEDLTIRRNKIIAAKQKRGSIKKRLEEFTDGRVEISFKPSQITIDFTGSYGSHVIGNEATDSINKVLPAHLPLVINYNLSLDTKAYYAGAIMYGENVTVYPWTQRKLETKGSYSLASGSHSIENLTIYPQSGKG